MMGASYKTKKDLKAKVRAKYERQMKQVMKLWDEFHKSHPNVRTLEEAVTYYLPLTKAWVECAETVRQLKQLDPTFGPLS